MLGICLGGFLWRTGVRFVFTAREYGASEGLRAIGRIPIANIITIIAGRKALVAYCRSLRTGRIVWDKTAHDCHPAHAPMHRAPA